MKDAKSGGRLMRTLDIVVVRMRENNSKRMLVEAEHRLIDGRQIITNRLPATKVRSGENVWGCARRLVETKLGLLDGNVNIRMGAEDIMEEEKESPSYPGLMSLNRNHFVVAFPMGRREEFIPMNGTRRTRVRHTAMVPLR